MFKRAFDIVLAIVALALVWPILIGVAILVKLDSPGPVFYRGVRTGRYGRPFRIFKFRTMVVGAEQLGGTTTGQYDLRITSTGRFLRCYKLDELPQLINVLLGNMSFVGPRPEVAEYTDRYTENESRILSVRPGITDLASLEFHDLQTVVDSENPDKTFREEVLPRKNELRLQYVDENSLRGDLSILIRTVLVVLKKPLRRAA